MCGTFNADHAQNEWISFECANKWGLQGTTVKVKPFLGNVVEFCGIKVYGHQTTSFVDILPDRKQGITIAVDPQGVP